MSKKKIAYALLGILLIAGTGYGIFAYQNIREKPPVVVEQDSATNASQTQESLANPGSTVVLNGSFVDGDALHKALGVAKIVINNNQPQLVFQDFKVRDGPDLFVYLSPNPPGQDLGEYASLGKLQSSSGDQTYKLPDNYKDYQTVVIWCRAFSVTFATAQLN